MFKIAFSIAKQYTEIGAICVRARELYQVRVTFFKIGSAFDQHLVQADQFFAF